MIAEAVDTLRTLGWAVLAWLAVGAFAAALGLLAVTAAVAWILRAAWRLTGARKGLYARLRAEVPKNAPRMLPTPQRRSQPRWALPDDETHKPEKTHTAA